MLLRIAVRCIVVAALLSQVAFGGNSYQPQSPVIGILSAPLEECPPVPSDFNDRKTVKATNATINACVFSYAVRLLESFGARAVVFPWNLTEDGQRKLISSVNGIWIPGGGLWGRIHAEYKSAVARLYRLAKQANANGDPFVLWGTCYGFELLMDIAADAEVVKGNYTGMDPIPVMLPLEFTDFQPTSRLFGIHTCPDHVRTVLSSQNSTLNWHSRALPDDAFASNAALRQEFVPLSLSTEPSGQRRFVSAVEATEGAEIYGVQFHPERPPFEFTFDTIGHSPADIAVSRYIGGFIVDRCRRNNHTFASIDDLERHRVAQWPLLDLGRGVQTYFTVDPSE
jgi:gamma-glutamyl hydrolase